VVPSSLPLAPQTGPAKPHPPAASTRGCPFALLARYGSSPSQPAAHWVVMADLEGNEFCVGTEPFSDT
jgi:hypothetical protein